MPKEKIESSFILCMSFSHHGNAETSFALLIDLTKKFSITLETRSHHFFAQLVDMSKDCVSALG